VGAGREGGDRCSALRRPESSTSHPWRSRFSSGDDGMSHFWLGKVGLPLWIASLKEEASPLGGESKGNAEPVDDDSLQIVTGIWILSSHPR